MFNKTLRPEPILCAAPALLLDRRTLLRTERTEHAAVAWLGAQQCLAVTALVVELAGVCWHDFLLSETAVRAGQNGLKDYIVHCVVINPALLSGAAETATATAANANSNTKRFLIVIGTAPGTAMFRS